MRRIHYSALFALIALSATTLLNSCCCDKDDSTVKDNPVVEVTSISITDAEGTVLSEIDMYQDSTFQFKVDVQPTNATDKSVTYTSDNESVASVTPVGLITAGAIGTANIKVATKDGKISSDLLVRVVLSEINIYQDSTFQLKVDVQLTNATDKTVTYTSDNEDVATVSSTGMITAGNIGTANIKVATNDGNFSANILVHVLGNYTRITRSLTDEGRAAQAVDLGLPSGTLWADRNIGASSESELGQWFYWGDVLQPEDNIFTEEQYKTLPAYNANADIAHTRFDIATLRWGGEWQLPTKAQIQELIDGCILIPENGGYRATSNSDPTKSILLPYTANCDHRGWVREYNNHNWGFYWSSTPYSNEEANHIYLNQPASIFSINPLVRYIGASVRPVQVPPSE